jgi:hypothetical protein
VPQVIKGSSLKAEGPVSKPQCCQLKIQKQTKKTTATTTKNYFSN